MSPELAARIITPTSNLVINGHITKALIEFADIYDGNIPGASFRHIMYSGRARINRLPKLATYALPPAPNLLLGINPTNGSTAAKIWCRRKRRKYTRRGDRHKVVLVDASAIAQFPLHSLPHAMPGSLFSGLRT